MEATASILFSPPHFHPSFHSFSLFKPSFPFKPSSSLIHLRISNSTLSPPHKLPLYPCNTQLLKPTFQLHSAVEETVTLEETPEETNEKVQKRKLYVVNLPWSLSSDELKSLFTQCGTVKDIELIRDKGGKNRGYGFVTMASGDEAQAVIDKFNSTEVSGRTIGVEYAKRLKKPRPQPPTAVPVKETRHKLYVSNLQWKVRSNHLRDFFSSEFSPVAARVIFERSPSGRSAGYGFVSFNTREEAEAAIASLDGKELLGRPVSLKFSEQNTEGEATKEGEATNEGEAINEGEATNEEEEKDILDESTGVLGENEVSVTQADVS